MSSTVTYLQDFVRKNNEWLKNKTLKILFSDTIFIFMTTNVGGTDAYNVPPNWFSGGPSPYSATPVWRNRLT